MMSFYRLDLFNELAKNQSYEFHLIFSAEKENNRRIWEINKDIIKFKYTILKSREIIKKGDGIKENRVINIPKGCFRALSKINPDVIIASEYNLTSIQGFIFSKIFFKKFISWSDGTLNSERFISKAQKLIRKIICKNTRNFIASSTETAEAQVTYGAKPDRVSISFLTIDVESFIAKLDEAQKTKNKVPKILFCGYLLRLKGIDLLFEALSKVKSDFTLDIIGIGEEEENLRQLSCDLGISEKISFLGFKKRDEIVYYYKNADLLVFPSLNDAFGLVLVEALAAELPIITSIYAGGSKDVVSEGVNGFIIDPQNLADFAEKLNRLLSDRALCEKMGKASFEKSKDFYLKIVVKGFFQAIERG